MGIWRNKANTKLKTQIRIGTSWKKWTFMVVIVVATFLAGLITSDNNVVKEQTEQLPYCGGQQQQDKEQVQNDPTPVPVGTNDNRDYFGDRSRSVILVSTIDGKITALNATDGSILWSHATKPDSLLSSTLDNLKFTNEGKRVHMVPSLDGDLYTFDGERMGSIPLSVDALLSNSMKMASDTVVSGGKEIRIYGINRNTGKLKYDCGSDGCSHFSETFGKIENPTENGINNDDDDVVIVRRLTKTVRAVSARTGHEKWNYSVGMHEVSLVSNPLNEGCHDDKDRASKITEAPTAIIRFMASEGIVLALNTSDSKREDINWKHQMSVPIIHAWQMKDNEMESLNLFDDDYNARDSSPQHRPLIHVGMYNNQLYVLEASNYREMLQLEWDTSGGKKYPMVTWKPYLISAHSRTPIILGNSESSFSSSSYEDYIVNKEEMASTALVSIPGEVEYPFDGGLHLYANGITLKNKSSHKPVSKISETMSSNYSTSIKEEEAETLDQIIIVSLWYWWKEVLIISISFAVLTNLCITRHLLHRMTKFTSRKENDQVSHSSAPSFIIHSVVKNIVVIQTSQPPLPQPCIAAPSKNDLIQAGTQMHSDTLNSSGDNSLSSPSISATMTPPVEFVSRYASDFEPIQKLGKGGFGVVVQARNKLDDCEYAIKRICMPNKNDRKARIMREVKALAKLDHVGIVRYYNAWLECPPADWKDNQFSTMDQDGMFSPSSSMTCDELQSIYSQRANQQQQQRLTGIGDNLMSSSWSQHTRKHFVNNNNQNEKSFSIDFPSNRRSGIRNVNESNNDDDSLNIVFEDSGCKSQLLDENVVDTSSNIEFKEESTKASAMKLSLKSEKDPGRNQLALATSPFVWEKPEKLYLYIQMQLCRKDNLKDWLNYNNDNRDKFEVLDYFHQIVSAVEYVHEQGLIHRDLKPSNIFFAQDGSIKVGDFGLAASTTPEALRSAASTPDRILPDAASAGIRHTHQVGTGLYMSPEQAAEKVYDHKVDIFSLGLIFFEMLVPFGTTMERVKVMMDARQLAFPATFIKYSPDEFQLTGKMLARDPQDRLSASDIKQHPLLQDFQPRPELLRRHRRGRNVSRSFSTSSSSGSGSGSGLEIAFEKDWNLTTS